MLSVAARLPLPLPAAEMMPYLLLKNNFHFSNKVVQNCVELLNIK
jgi:hypothetical protein